MGCKGNKKKSIAQVSCQYSGDPHPCPWYNKNQVSFYACLANNLAGKYMSVINCFRKDIYSPKILDHTSIILLLQKGSNIHCLHTLKLNSRNVHSYRDGSPSTCRQNLLKHYLFLKHWAKLIKCDKTTSS